VRPGDPPAPADEALVEIYQRDAESVEGRAAASELLRRYEGPVFQWCRRQLGDRERALDVTQEVLTRAWKSLGTFQRGSKVSWWMFVIARNRCRTLAGRRKWLTEDDVGPDDLPHRDPAPDEAYLQRLEEDALLRLIETHLDSDERRALWLCCFECVPIDEITAILELPGASGARGLLQRARRKLRAALERRRREES